VFIYGLTLRVSRGTIVLSISYYLSIYRFIDLSFYRFIDLSFYRFIVLSIYRFIVLSIYRFIDLSFYRSFYYALGLSIC